MAILYYGMDFPRLCVVGHCPARGGSPLFGKRALPSPFGNDKKTDFFTEVRRMTEAHGRTWEERVPECPYKYFWRG